MINSIGILDITGLLDGYCDNIQNLILEKEKTIANEGVKELKATSHVNKKILQKKVVIKEVEE